MTHIALLGDSIFDNGSYTGGGPDVAVHLRTLLPPPAVTLCAVDGARIADVDRQLGRVPQETTHLFLSVGGNDALQNLDLLDRPVGSMTEALALLHGRVSAFYSSYERLLERLLELGRPVTVCAMHNGNLGPEMAPLAEVAAALFNDAILRAALRHGLPAIDLRAVCNRPDDFVNAIEPSVSGGRKIAEAIIRSLEPGAAGTGRSILTGGRPGEVED
jgi:hypothetical protein